jgi:hypothetical protein
MLMEVAVDVAVDVAELFELDELLEEEEELEEAALAEPLVAVVAPAPEVELAEASAEELAEAEAEAEPVAEPLSPESTVVEEDEEEVEEDEVELVELEEEVVLAPSETAVELLFEEAALEAELELELLELELEVSANTDNGEAESIKTRLMVKALENAVIWFFIMKSIVFSTYKNMVNALKLPCIPLRYNVFHVKK